MNNIAKQNDEFTVFPSLMNDFFNMDRFFSDDFFPKNFMQRLPAVNILENGNSFRIEAAVPGFRKEDLKVNVDDGVLYFEGNTSQEKKEENERFTRREFQRGSFSRSFRLPANVDAGKVEAVFENGVLKLSIPKKEGTATPSAREVKIS